MTAKPDAGPDAAPDTTPDAAPWRPFPPGAGRGRPPWLADVGTVLAVGIVQILGTYLASRHQSGRHSWDALAVVLLAAGTIALLWRRRYPGAVLVVVFGTTLAYSVTNYPRGPVFAALIVAYVNAVMAGRRRLAWASIAAGYVLFLWLPDLFGTQRTTTPDAVGLAAWLLVLAGAAEMLRFRRERAAIRARGLRRRR